MPPTKQRSFTSAAVQKAAIEQAGLSLQELPEKPKSTWSLREAVSLLQDSITTALDRGYSHEEVAAILAEQGVSITASSLKRYLAAARREKDGAAKSKTKQSRKPLTNKRGAVTQAEKISDAAAALESTAHSTSAETSEGTAAPTEDAAPSRKRRAQGTSSRTKASDTSESPAAAKTAAKTRSTSRTKTAPRSTSTRSRKRNSSSSNY